MTSASSTRLVRPSRSPSAWQGQFRQLMTELKAAGRRVIRRRRVAGLSDILDRLDVLGGRPGDAGLVDHILEFAAFHLPGPAGCTIAECAVDAAEHLPAGVRGGLASLARSHWDLYEVDGAADDGGLRLRRIYDDTAIHLGAMEAAQPFVVGAVAAMRIFDAGGFRAAPVAMAPPRDRLGELISRLEIEQAGASKSRAVYMRLRGSTVILEHLLTGVSSRAIRPQPSPNPSVALVESDLEDSAWKRLEKAFGLIEAAVGDGNAPVCPRVVDLPDASVVRVDRQGPSVGLMVFESADDHQRWRHPGDATDRKPTNFLRAWRTDGHQLFAEDVQLLEDQGLDPTENGAVVGVRLADGRWEDLDEPHLERIIDVCRKTALKLVTDPDLAA